MIPNVSTTESIFFLVDLESFTYAWHNWLGPGLQARKFYVTDFANQLADSYSALFKWLKNQWESPNSPIGKVETDEDMTNPLQVIIHRTFKLKASLVRLEAHLHQNDINETRRVQLEAEFGRGHYQVISCDKCYGLPAEQQCSRVVQLEHQEVNHILKHGISLVPESERLAEDNRPTGSTPVHSPYELNMTRFAKNPDTVARCAREILVLVDSSQPMVSPPSESRRTDTVQVRGDHGTHYFQPLDFIIYDGLDSESLAESVLHQKNLRYMAPIARRNKFSDHGDGLMYGARDRQAAGGARGDTFGGYKNEEAETIRGLHVQFDHLVSGAMMDAVARFACPFIWHCMQDDIKSAAKLGITGHNIYACNGYSACIHTDVDAGHGLCIQLEWLADRRYDEYGFCQPSWRYWIATEPNTLWSFCSAHPHGTMLPSRRPLDPKMASAPFSGYQAQGQSAPSGGQSGAPSGGQSGGQLGPASSSHHNLRSRDNRTGRVALPVPTRTSTGRHKTLPKKNVRAAQKHARAIHTVAEARSYWQQ